MHVENINWEGKTILVAEDDIANYKMVEQYLHQAKARVIWAETGEEALFFAKHAELCIDAVIMDVQMPDLDGYQATQKLKASHPHLPVIMLSSHAQTSLYLGKADIFDGRVSKPVQKTKLIEMLQYCFENVSA